MMTRFSNKSRSLHSQRGFSLIEGLFSALILAIALLALAGFHVGAFQDSSLVKGRMAATTLAQEKLDDLRSFTLLKNITTTSNECTTNTTFCFSEIGGNTGGRETDTGVLALPSGSVSGFLDNFRRTWTVTCATSEPSGSALSFSTTCTDAIAKLVTVEIRWDDNKGVEQLVSLQSVIYSMDPANGASVAVGPVSGKGPKISYTPNNESVPISIGGGKSTETSRPLPEVSGGDSRRVTLPSVVYTGSTGSETVVTKEEFVTVNCTCKLKAAAELAWTPHRTVWNGSALEQEYGIRISKTVGEPSDLSNNGTTNQDPLCIQCCADHHDTNASTTESGTNPGYPTYRPYVSRDEFLSTGDHKHYQANGTEATTTSHVYVEACRMKRIDGFWRVVADWQLLDVAVFGCDYFSASTNSNCPQTGTPDASKLTLFRTWLQNVLKQFVAHVNTNQGVNTGSVAFPVFTSTVTPLLSTGNSAHDISLGVGANKQLITRGIYADVVFKKLSSGTPRAVDTDYVSAILPISANSDYTRLQYVPFYDANLTLLANWSPTSTNTNNSNNPPQYGDCSAASTTLTYNETPLPDSAVCVTSQPINLSNNPALAYYTNTYSRGRIYGKRADTAALSTLITASVARGNNGLTSSPSLTGTTDSVQARQVKVTIPGTSTTNTVGVSGSVTRGNSGASLANIIITPSSPTGVSCSFNDPGGLATASSASYTCTVPSGWSGTLTFSSSATGYTFSPAATTGTIDPITLDGAPIDAVIAYGPTASLFGKLYASNAAVSQVTITTSTGQTCSIAGTLVTCPNVQLTSNAWSGTVRIANNICGTQQDPNALCTNNLKEGATITRVNDCNGSDTSAKTTGTLTAGPGNLGTSTSPTAFTFCAN